MSSRTELGPTAGSSPPGVEELVGEVERHHPGTDGDLIRRAYAWADAAHDGQRRHSGEPFITHPLGAARICADLALDAPAIAAALLHDTVEDTDATLEAVEEEFGAEIAQLVDGVTKLSKLAFDSREEHQAENYRKLIIAMAKDLRVLVIKLADRLHNMRTLGYHKKDKQLQKARETLDVYAPLAHRLGISSLKWELEDLSFAVLHPRRYAEIQTLVDQRRTDREHFVAEAGEYLEERLREAGINLVEISGRAKHFYSIYDKMTRRGKEFNEIYDLTAMRVLVDSVKDCYGAVGIVHSLWQPMPGRFKDYVAMPKINRYQSLHTTVIGPGGKPLEIQIRTIEMHRMAEFGVAAHWLYKDPGADPAEELPWLGGMLDWQEETTDPAEFLDTLRSDLFQGEVYVFTPKGEVRNLPVGSTPIDFAYDVHTDVGHRCAGAKVNGRIVPLTYELQSGDIIEVLTAKSRRAPSRDWLALVKTGKARSKIRQFLTREKREGAEHTGRDALQEALRRAGLPSQKVVSSSLLAEIIKEMGFSKAADFYISLGMGKSSTDTVVNKVMQRLKAGQEVEDSAPAGRTAPRPRSATASSSLGIEVDGLADVLVRMARCCNAVPGDPIVGYISLGRGITVHREDCPNVGALRKNPERFTDVTWSGGSQQAFRVDIAVDAWDRPRLLEDISRAFSEHGGNIITASCRVDGEMVHDRFLVEVGDPETLREIVGSLRQLESVFDAYRLSPGSG